MSQNVTDSRQARPARTTNSLLCEQNSQKRLASRTELSSSTRRSRHRDRRPASRQRAVTSRTQRARPTRHDTGPALTPERLPVLTRRSGVTGCLLGKCFAVVIEHRSRGIRIAWSNPIRAVTKNWRMPSTSSRKASLRSAGAKACQEMRATENGCRPRSRRTTSRRTDMRWLPPQ